ncbi:MAG: MMPL family transporter [Dehalococcoidia bacterium]|nr:MMPL family transporter [Dehalococcoidia bacterium]
MFAALGRFVFRYRWFLIGFWVLVFAASLVFAPRVSDVLTGEAYEDVPTEATQASAIIQRDLGQSPSSLTAVFSSDSFGVTDPRFQQAMAAFLSGLDQHPQIQSITTYASLPSLVSTDGKATFVVLALRDPNAGKALYAELKTRLPASGDVRIAVTGLAAVNSDIMEVSERDLQRAEMISLPLVLLALIVVFGTLLAAGAPLIVGAVSVVTTLALVYFLGHYTDMSVFVLNVASMLGLGIAIDYSLFLVSRFREELKNGDVERATVTTVATAGKAIFFSGAITFAAMMGLVFFKFTILRSMGIGGGLVVLISMLAALTFLPAVLAAAGTKINALPMIPRWGQSKGGSFWHNLAVRVMKRPIVVMVVTVALLLALGVPFLSVRMGEPDATILPENVSSRQGYDMLKESFGEGAISPIAIAVKTTGDVFQPENIGALYDFTRDIAQDGRVRQIDSLVTIDPSITKQQYQMLYSNPSLIPPQYRTLVSGMAKGETTMIRVTTDLSPVSTEAKEVVDRIRSLDKKGLEVYVGGLTAGIDDVVDILYRDFPWIILFVVVVIYGALVLFFRSVILPLKAVVMDGLSIVASYGALVFIFQQGHFSNVLGFTQQQSVEASLPIIMFCILFGLSMDYEVFLLSRVKEAYDATGENTFAVALGLERTGGIITSAALIMVLVSVSFAFADIVVIKALGLGIAIAICLDATIVRSLLVPATMRILGKWNWWAPGFLRKVLPAGKNLH